MPYCKYCGRHVPESEGCICEYCLDKESQVEEHLPYPLLLAPPKPKKITKSWTTLLIISIAAGAVLFFFLLGRRIL